MSPRGADHFCSFFPEPMTAGPAPASAQKRQCIKGSADDDNAYQSWGSDSCSKLPAGTQQPTHFDVMTNT